MESMRRVSEIEPLETTLTELRKAPSELYILGFLGAVAVSLLLFMSGRRWASLFVGLWPPTILAFGMYNKLIGPTRPSR